MRVFVLALAALFAAPAADYRADVQMFRIQRAKEILGPNGWASLVDLHWLTPGEYTIGKAATNTIVLPAPSAPARIGTLSVTTDGATLVADKGVPLTMDGRPVASATLSVGSGADTMVSIGKVSMTLIKRGQRLALRVWDEAAPTRQALHELNWMPIDPSWHFNATWEPHTPVPRAPILNVLGETIQMANPGEAVFVVKGETYRLEAFLEGSDAKQLFFMFRDGTSNKTTYGAGRYLYTPLPKDGHVDLDFNRAMNPPCAFTDFATCPLPPAKNRLLLPIAAGELDSGHRH